MDKNFIIKRAIQKLSKGEDVSYKYHSTQINLDDCCSEKDYNFYKIQKLIEDKEVYREYPRILKKDIFGFNIKVDDPREEYGYERIAHITTLYGLTNDKDFFDMREKLKNYGKINFTIGKIDSFRGKDKPYDVIVVEIISPRLEELHNFLKENYKNEYKYPQYKPHLTLAYVNKGACKDIEGNCLWTGHTYTAVKILWSHKDKYLLDIPLVS